MSHLSSEILIDYAHGALDAEADATAFRHLAECSNCRAEYDEEIAVIECLRSKAAAEERELPASLAAAIMRAAREERSPTLRFAFNFNMGRSLAALAAAGAVAAFVPFAMHFPHSATIASVTTVSANSFFTQHEAAIADIQLFDHSGTPSIETAELNGNDEPLPTEGKSNS